MKTCPSQEHPIYARLQSTERMLQDVCICFVGMQHGAVLSNDQSARLLSVLDQPHGLIAFSRELRPMIRPGRFNTAPFWGIIDALGFWEGAHPGVWPYMSDSGWNRYLDWAEELAGHVMSGTIH